MKLASNKFVSIEYHISVALVSVQYLVLMGVIYILLKNCQPDFTLQCRYPSSGYYIQPSVNNKCPGFFFRFRRKLARTKTQQSTDKVSEHNGRTVFSWALIFLTRSSTGVVSTSPYHLSSIFITLPHNLHQLPIFASASVTNRVCRHRQSTPPPLFRRACKII